MKVQPTTKQLIEMLYERLPELFDRPPAAQRQWVGLTDEEVQTAWNSVMDGAVFTRRKVYEAIEAKLRSNNT